MPEFAAKVADAHGLKSLATFGWPTWSPGQGFPALSLLRLGPGLQSDTRNGRIREAWWSDAALVANLQGAEFDPTTLVRLLDRVPMAVLSVADVHGPSTLDMLERARITPTFVGRAPSTNEGTASLLVLDRRVAAQPPAAPSAFRILAVLTAYNEADIVESTINALHLDGADIHVIDNWSTDGSYEIALRLANAGVISLERYPTEPSTTYNEGDLLRRVERIAADSSADWIIHHDVDERRRAPWPRTSMRDALWEVERSGFNAINHTVLTFRPVADSWAPGLDLEAHFRYFELERRLDLLHQVKAWQSKAPIDLASSAGHDATFAGRRVFPYNFLLKHYPLRSQEHAERKIFRERRGRWNPEERAQGWHHHYDDAFEGQSFIWSTDGLYEFVDVRTQAERLIELVGGAELGQPWANDVRMHAAEMRHLSAQTVAFERGLGRVIGGRFAASAVRRLRKLAWIVRPFRRKFARWRLRRSRTS